jgi:hypothetical protein
MAAERNLYLAFGLMAVSNGYERLDIMKLCMKIKQTSLHVLYETSFTHEQLPTWRRRETLCLYQAILT